ncbi:energy transducer TonB [Blastomonas sp. AAP53]|uniref:energy transducer TonB n=1 Tax=Blastomonas sp. AAP53 TaxID=1248760 RepID=UPI0002EED7FE|nr:energy transducer TonB [Blastomonas sp. AAP53]
MVLEFDSLSSAMAHGSCSASAYTAEPEPAPSPSRTASTHATAGRYGEGGKSRLPAIVLAIGIHLALAPALLSLGYQAVKRHDASLTAINLSPPPPPPPSPPAEPKAQTLQTTVEPAQVTITSQIPKPVIAMVPTSLPQVPAMSIAAPPAAVAAPAPAPPAAPPTVTADALGTRMISGSPPRYPVESRRKKEQGIVELLLILGTDGRVESISVARSSGFARLDDAALSAVRRWRWAPTVRDGGPVKVKGVVEIPFVLTNG